jgi:hypothetical protein
MFATAICESIYPDIADQNTRSNPTAYPKETIHWNEMNDKIFNI